MHDCPSQPAPPASGGVRYYPARFRASYPNIRAALAFIGLRGKAAALHLANAKAEASDLVAVPVVGAAGGADALVLILRKPGGRADVWTGIPDEARGSEREAAAVAAEFAQAIPGRWCVIEWVRQSGAVQ